MYDIIGDIHGHYAELHALLLKLGYRYDSKKHLFSHPARQVLFIGDLVDRGLENLKVINLVRNMVDAGLAQIVMGNHDYNAVQYATPHPDEPGVFLRKHDEKNRSQHKTFLAEVEHDPALYADTIAWFKTMPIVFKDGLLHAVHACWDGDALIDLKLRGAINPDFTITERGWIQGGLKGSREYDALEMILKGPEERLGQGLKFDDGHGIMRSKARVIWWNTEPKLFGDAFAIPADAPYAKNPYVPTPDNAHSSRIRGNLKHQALMAFGHYWMRGAKPSLISDRIICVDWSVAKGGMLVAYRYDGEERFSPDKFVSVPVIKRAPALQV